MFGHSGSQSLSKWPLLELKNLNVLKISFYILLYHDVGTTVPFTGLIIVVVGPPVGVGDGVGAGVTVGEGVGIGVEVGVGPGDPVGVGAGVGTGVGAGVGPALEEP